MSLPIEIIEEQYLIRQSYAPRWALCSTKLGQGRTRHWRIVPVMRKGKSRKVKVNDNHRSNTPDMPISIDITRITVNHDRRRMRVTKRIDAHIEESKQRTECNHCDRYRLDIRSQYSFPIRGA